jgi:hypothetical protein
MRPKPDFDPEFPAHSRRWYWPIRSIGQLMIVIALSGLVLSVVPLRSRPAPPVRTRPRFSRNPIVIQGPVWGLQARGEQPRDRFVVIAPREIDPGMVVYARPDLDEGMVFSPYANRPVAPAARIPGLGPALPSERPGPTPDQFSPSRLAPQPPAVPEAEAR